MTSLRPHKDIANFARVILACLAKPIKIILPTWDFKQYKDFHVHHHVKHQLYNSILSWDIAKILRTWPRPLKAIALTCRKLWCLSVNKKPTWSLNFFERYCTLMNPAIWLAKNILGNNSWTRIFPDMGFAMKSQESKEFSFCITLGKNRWQN